MLGGSANGLDVAVIRAGMAARAASSVATDAGVFLNYAGGAPATLGLALGGTIILWRRGDRARAIAFAGIVVGGRLLAEAIKLMVHRARPALDPHPVATHSLSFPSAHAANSMIAFTALVLFFVDGPWRARALVLAVAASIVIGSSRPLLGVHWPSDVIAGWSIGAAWMLACWPIARGIGARRQPG